jgi:hypothetical protein
LWVTPRRTGPATGADFAKNPMRAPVTCPAGLRRECRQAREKRSETVKKNDTNFTHNVTFGKRQKEHDLLKRLPNKNHCSLKTDFVNRRNLANQPEQNLPDFDQRKQDYLAFQLAMVRPIIVKSIRADSPNNEKEIL